MSEKKQFPIIPGAEPFRLKAKGPKILLIHGFTATPTEVRPIGNYLYKKKYDIYSILLPGHGTAPEDLQTKKVADWQNSITEIFDENNGFDFVVGFSMGALLAAQAAIDYEKQLKGLILISSFLKIKPKILSRVAFLFPIMKYLKPYFSKSEETAQYFKDNNLISYLKYPMSAVHEAVKLSKYTQRNVLSKIKIPTLIIQGEKDDRVDPEGYKILQKLIPTEDKELVLLPDSQHIVSVGPDKELLFKSIHQFINKRK
ncbi:MAG: alpha/beta fold hydrolase [Candidatus Heimdallarchaeota archaeon]|nr:alpha/beta fold hydrolase [Candidatus Heimdallarchaeota archaeon]MBY8995456.1 alpha/beta fold hydrolase [Candidatus Heimdallarchaeota archaeon]